MKLTHHEWLGKYLLKRMHNIRLTFVPTGRLLGDQRHRWDPAAKRMFSARKRSGSYKAPSRSGNQSCAVVISEKNKSA